MKKIIAVLFLTLSLCSCSVTDDAPNYTIEALPIESVDVPETFQFGQVYEITVSYLRPTGCHVFNSFLFDAVDGQTTVLVANTVYDDVDCEVFDNELVEASFNFQVNVNEDHTFRFWQGKDDNGSDVYLIVEVPIED